MDNPQDIQWIKNATWNITISLRYIFHLYEIKSNSGFVVSAIGLGGNYGCINNTLIRKLCLREVCISISKTKLIQGASSDSRRIYSISLNASFYATDLKNNN